MMNKMRFLKEKKSLIISFIIGVILASSITVYATINADNIEYRNGQKLSNALDDLYNKIQSPNSITFPVNFGRYTSSLNGYTNGFGRLLFDTSKFTGLKITNLNNTETNVQLRNYNSSTIIPVSADTVYNFEDYPQLGDTVYLIFGNGVDHEISASFDLTLYF